MSCSRSGAGHGLGRPADVALIIILGEQRLSDDAAARDLVIVHDNEPACAVAAGVGGVERRRAVEPEDHLGDFVFLHLAALQTVQLRGVYDAENALRAALPPWQCRT